MRYEEAKQLCHVRSAIYRTSNPELKIYKNHPIPMDLRVSWEDRGETDWEEYDPRDDPHSPRYNETPA